jgi:uncharacterized protein (DUF488 family)
MTLYTIGHSNTESAAFIALLQRHAIELLVDVRSQPYSRYNPQFNRETLKHAVNQAGIAYAFLGDSLGGMPADRRFHLPDGKVDYDLLAQAESFQTGLEKLLNLAAECRVAFMCAEADYHHCHRYKLITRALVRRSIEVRHIVPTGELELSTAADFEQQQPALF